MKCIVATFVLATVLHAQVHRFDRLAAGDEHERRAALSYLEDAGSCDEVAWRTLLARRDDPGFFASVVRGLGRVGEPVHERLLALVLDDRRLEWTEGLSHAAGLAVGLSGNVDLMPKLASRAMVSDVFFAVGLMKKAPGRKSGDLLRRAIAGRPMSVLAIAPFADPVESALRWGAVVDEPAFAALARNVLLASGADVVRRRAAIDYFARSKSKAPPELCATLRGALFVRDPEMAGLAARALAKSEGAGEEDVAAIEAAFAKASSLTRVDQARALGGLPIPAAGAALSRMLAASLDDPAVCRTILEALLVHGAKLPGDAKASAAAVVARLVSRDSMRPAARVDVVAAAVSLVASVDPAQFAGHLPSIRLAGPWQVRAALPAAFAKCSPPDREGLRRCLADPDRRVRIAALEAISEDPAFLGLVDWRAHTDVVEIAVLATALAKAGGGDVDEFLVAAVERVPEHEVEALQSVIDLAGKVKSARSIAILHRYATSREISLRRRARSQLAAVGITVPEYALPASECARLLEAAARRAHGGRREVVIDTSRGSIVVALFPEDAPATVENFVRLARSGFYDGILWHRVVPGFVAQAGCPRGDGWGGPGYTIRCEVNDRTYRRGSVGMALAGKDTGGSQFFICHRALPHLDGRYTQFGHVTRGMDVVDRLGPEDVILRVRER